MAVQESRNEIAPEDDHKLRIATVGESTTADHVSDGRYAWPRQLQERLARAGVSARVYNLGRFAATTTTLRERLPEQLDRFRPHIVITMMGINDSASFVSENTSSWNRLRVVKLFRWLLSLRQPPEVARLPRNCLEPDETEAILAGLRSPKPWPHLETAEKKMSGLDQSAKASCYLFLAYSLDQNRGLSPKTLARELTTRSVLLEFQSGELLDSVIDYLGQTSREEECLALAKQFVERGYSAGDSEMHHYSVCARIALEKSSSGWAEWPDLLKRMKGGGVVYEELSAAQVRSRNYRAIHALLAERGIEHIAMQYPLLPVSSLKEYFGEPVREPAATPPEILFVENLANFKAALKNNKYEDLFYDRFAGSFGHATYLGQSLIAETAAGAVLEILKK